MNNEQFSLCIPYYNFREGKNENFMWRIADYSQDQKEFEQARYTTQGDVDYLPPKLATNPRTIQAFRPSIFKWTKNIDGKVRSSDTGTLPYELIKLNENLLDNFNADFKIKNELYEGVEFYEHTLYEFLLIVNEDEYYYEAIYLRKKFSSSNDKKIFKIDKICQDISKITHKVDFYKILKSDIIDTSESGIYQDKYKKAPIRYFYKYLDLPNKSRSLELREPRDYAEAFISKYLKNKSDVLETTNKDRQRIARIINTAFNDKEEIEEFYKETGFEVSEIQLSLLSLNVDIQNFLIANDRFSEIVEDAFFRNDTLSDTFLNVAKELWIKQKDEESKMVEQELQAKQAKLTNIEKDYKDLNDILNQETVNMNLLENKILLKKSELQNLNENIKDTKNKIQLELKNFQNDVVHLATISAFSNTQQSEQNNLQGYLIQEDFENFEENLDLATTIEDFYDDLKNNLEVFGVLEDSISAITQIIVATILSQRNLILDANSENIANAISALIDNKNVNKIFITDSNLNAQNLVNYINSLESKIVLIYGLFDTFNEKVFVMLSHLCKDKFIIFSCEDTETFDILPLHWWSYATILSIRNDLTFIKLDDYFSYLIHESLFEYEHDMSVNFKEIKRDILKENKNNDLNQVKLLAYIELFSIIKNEFDNYEVAKKFLIKEENTFDEVNEV